MLSGTLDLNLKKSSFKFQVLSLWTEKKNLKIITACFFFQQQFTLYLYLDVLGAFNVRED